MFIGHMRDYNKILADEHFKENGPIRTCFIIADVGKECRVFGDDVGPVPRVTQLGTDRLCLVGLRPLCFF